MNGLYSLSVAAPELLLTQISHPRNVCQVSVLAETLFRHLRIAMKNNGDQLLGIGNQSFR